MLEVFELKTYSLQSLHQVANLTIRILTTLTRFTLDTISSHFIVLADTLETILDFIIGNVM